MKKSNKNTSSSYNTLTKVVCRLTGFLILITMLSGAVIGSSITHADTTVSSNASVIVNASCTITTGGGEYSETIDPGTSKTITGNGINVSCNDSGGYALYAIGFSGDSYDTPNNNRMLGPNSLYIPTANSGSNSYWAMKAAGSSTTSNVPTIDNSYSDFQIIPATYTKISHYNSSTTGTTTNSVTTPTYKINIASTQSAGSYTGKVKYTMVHPNTAPAPSSTYMQNLASSQCTTTPITVVDRRDNKEYKIQRLADGKCWMLENLRLDLMDSAVQANLNNNTTNATDTSLAYLKGTATYRDPTTDPNGKYPTAALGHGDSNNYYSVPKISVSGTCYNAYCVDSPQSGQWNSEVITPATINGVTSIAQGKVGIYYNYCAVSAGSYCYGNGTASDGSPTSDPDPSSLQDVKEDICPKGWRLPTSSDNGEFQTLYASYNSDYAAFQTALITPLSGYFYSGTSRSQGGGSRFWSSTWVGIGSVYGLRVYSSDIFPFYDYNRYGGYSLRCMLDS